MLDPNTTEKLHERVKWHTVGTQAKKMNASEAADTWWSVGVTDKPPMWRQTWQVG